MVARKSTVKVGVCICPLTIDEEQNGIQNIVHTEENEVKISMGSGKGQKSYEADFEVFNDRFFLEYYNDSTKYGRVLHSL